jgi:hypothetical protein
MGSYKQKLNPLTGRFNLVMDTALLKLKGTVDTVNDLPLTGNSENDCYIVKTTDRIYTWNKVDPEGILSDWVNVGSASEIDWASITNKPSSSVANIDDAVAKKHTAGEEQDILGTVKTGQSITKGKVVRLSVSSGNLTQELTELITTLGEETIFNNTPGGVNGDRISDTQAVIGNTLGCRIATVSDLTVAFGTSTSYSEINAGFSLKILDSTHCILSFQTTDDFKGKAMIGVIADGIITFGSLYTFSNNVISCQDITLLDSTHIAITYLDGDIGTGIIKTIIGIISEGTVITFGTPVEVGVFNEPHIITLDSTHFVLSYSDGSNGYAMVGTVTGDVIVLSIAFAVETEENTGVLPLCPINSTTFTVIQSGADGLRARLGTYADGSLTFSVKSIITDYPVRLKARTVSSTLFMVSYTEYPDHLAVKTLFITRSGAVYTPGTPITMKSGVGIPSCGYCPVPLTSSKVGILYAVDKSYCKIGTFSVTANLTLLGISTETKTEGLQCRIRRLGSITGLTGLTPYKAYFSNGANLTTTIGDERIGTSLSATELFVGMVDIDDIADTIATFQLNKNNYVKLEDGYITGAFQMNSFTPGTNSGSARLGRADRPVGVMTIQLGSGGKWIDMVNSAWNFVQFKIYDGGGWAIGTHFNDINPGLNNMIIEGKVGIGIAYPSEKLDVVGNAKIAGKIISAIASDEDLDTDEILESSIGASYGLLIVRELTSEISAVYRVEGEDLILVSANALFSLVKDNAGTYNVYFDGESGGCQEFVVQNRVGDNKDIKIGFHGV